MTIIAILALIAAVALVLIVLIQKPKGGGIANNFAGANTIFGVKKTTEVVEKGTWYLSGFIALLLLIASGFNSKSSGTDETDLTPSEDVERGLENAPAETPKPAPNTMNFDQGQQPTVPADAQPVDPATGGTQ